MQDLLQHYTSKEVLKSMLEHKTFHLTHYKFLNDPSEGEFGVRIVHQFLSKFMKKIDGAVCAPDFEKKFFSSFAQTRTKLPDPYIASFCKAQKQSYKDGLLSMWRAYANYGVSIGFDRSKIEERARNNFGLNGIPYVLFEDVMYLSEGDEDSSNYNIILKTLVRIISDDNELRNRIKINEVSEDSVSDKIEKALKVVQSLFLGKEDKEFSDESLIMLSILDVITHIIKHKGYEEEKEFRVCIGYPIPEDREKRYANCPKLLKFKKTGLNDDTPYLEIPMQTDVISNVIIGPMHVNRQDIEVISIRELVYLNKLNIQVLKSTIPHR